MDLLPALLRLSWQGKLCWHPPCACSSPSCSACFLPTISFPHGDGFWRRPLWRGDPGKGTRRGGGGGGGNAQGACVHLRSFGLCCCSLPSSVVRGSVPLPVLLSRSCCPSARTVPSDTWPICVCPPRHLPRVFWKLPSPPPACGEAQEPGAVPRASFALDHPHLRGGAWLWLALVPRLARIPCDLSLSPLSLVFSAPSFSSRKRPRS